MHGEIFYCYSTSWIILDWQLFCLYSNIFWRSKKINHLKVRNKKLLSYLFVVDFDVTDSNSYSLIKLSADLMIDLLNSSWNNSSLLVVVGESQHSECLTCSSLSITHHGTIVSRDNTLHNRSCGNIIHIILSSIMKDVVETELPVV